MATIQADIIMATEEVVFQFFLRRSGKFKFTDTLAYENHIKSNLKINDLIIDQAGWMNGRR